MEAPSHCLEQRVADEPVALLWLLDTDFERVDQLCSLGIIHLFALSVQVGFSSMGSRSLTGILQETVDILIVSNVWSMLA